MFQTAFISGASRGIGKAIAKELAAKGYHLSLTCHNNTKLLENFAEELRKEYHIEVLTFSGDMGDASFVEQVAKETLDTFHQIDVIINNAGIAHIGLLHEMSTEDWNSIINTNLSSCFYTAKYFTPSMIEKKKGSIVSISSMWGSIGASCEVAYSASKGGMNAFTKALAKELAPSHIQVNAIACGVIDTDMNHMLEAEDRDALASDIPAGRFASPEEVAQTVLSIIKSPAYLTGQVIGLDGGYV